MSSPVVFVSEIVTVLVNDAYVIEERTRFVHGLNTPPAERKQWDDLYIMGTSSSYQHFTKLIDEWVQRTPTPSLGHLREILKSCGFRSAVAWYEMAKATRAQMRTVLNSLLQSGSKYFPDSFKSLGDDSTIIKINQSTTSSPIIVIFFKVTPPSSFFVGRESEVKELHEFFHSRSPPLVVISGMGGQGKTQLCRQFIKTLKEKGPSSTPAVTWLGGDNAANLTSSVIQLAEHLNIPTNNAGKPAPLEELLLQVSDNISIKSSNGWLVVIDNVDETYQEFQTTVPALVNGSAFVLVTARKIDILSGEAKQFKLGVLRQEDAEELVVKCMNQQPSDQDIKDICHDLGNHALALRQALAYINAQQNEDCSSYGIQEYLQQLAKDRMLLQNQVFMDGYDQTIYLIVTRTMKTILEKHADEGRRASEMMEVLCLVRPDGISKECLQKFVNIINASKSQPQWSDGEMHKALVILKKYSMISFDIGTISIHRLVQKFAKSESSNAVNVILQGIEIENSSKEELQQTMSIWEHADTGTVQEHTGLPCEIVSKMQALDMFLEIRTFTEKNIQLLTELLGPDNENTMRLQHTHGIALQFNCDDIGALTIFTDLLQKAKAIFGETYQFVLEIESNICNSLQQLNRLEEALAGYQQLLELQIKAFGPNHRDAMNTCDRLGNLLTCMGMNEGFQIQTQTLLWRKENLGENHLETMHSRIILGHFYMKSGMFNEARLEFEAVIKKSVESEGDESPLTSSAKFFLSHALWELGEAVKATITMEEVLQLQEKTFGPNHAVTKATRDFISDIRTGVRPKKFKQKIDQGSETGGFIGTGYTLDTATSSTTSKDSLVQVHLWSNGFILDDGPFRNCTDVADTAFLISIARNTVPEELRQKLDGKDCILSMIDRRTETYTPQQQQVAGFGQTLGSQTTTSTTTPSVESRKIMTKAMENVALNSELPTTSIQFRLMDGSRLAAKFNHTHTIQDLYNFINTARPEYANTNYVLTLFPNVQLTDKEQSLKDANIPNSSLTQKMLQ